MKLNYLGTAAAEGWPGVFCNCEKCKAAASLGGRNIRTRSQALINEDLLLDLPPDTYLHKLTYQLDLSAVKHLLITHWHMDHFYPQELSIRGSCYSHNMTSEDLHIYCAEEVKDFFYKVAGWEIDKESEREIHWHLLKAFCPVWAGEYKITPLPARHMKGWPKEHPFFYLIEEGDNNILYCHDTGVFYQEVWDYLDTLSIKLSLISFDCTHGIRLIGESGGHMGTMDADNIRKRLQEKGLCTEKTICVLNHFSHNDALLYDEMCGFMEKEGYVVSYDGLQINLQK